MHCKASGFTVIELVVVIILLAILAASALPRFINADGGAHAAAFASMQDRLQAGIARFHAEWLTASETGPVSVVEAFGGLRANANGFPYGTDGSDASGSDVADADDCAAVLSHVVRDGAPTVATASGTAAVPAAGANVDYVAVWQGGLCRYYYTAGTANLAAELRTLSYDSVSGQITAGVVAVSRHAPADAGLPSR